MPCAPPIVPPCPEQIWMERTLLLTCLDTQIEKNFSNCSKSKLAMREHVGGECPADSSTALLCKLRTSCWAAVGLPHLAVITVASCTRRAGDACDDFCISVSSCLWRSRAEVFVNPIWHFPSRPQQEHEINEGSSEP